MGGDAVMPLFLAAVGRLSRLKAAYDAHAALSVSGGAHGAGTMAVQNKNAVDIDGGAIDGTPIGVNSMETVDGKRIREARNDMGNNTAFPLDWAAYGAFRIAPTGTYTVTHTNKPAAGRVQMIVVEIVNGGAYSGTWTGVTWISAAPILKSSGTDYLYFMVLDGSTVLGGQLN